MAKDKFSAIWVSHSSIGDFLKCPRLYYLRNVYKDPKTGHKITVMKPPLALGQIIHEIIESLSEMPVEERFSVSPLKKLEVAWKKISGKLGGFKDLEEEREYKERAQEMLKNIIQNPGPLAKKAVKIRSESGLPYYWLSEEENIILCGKIDWLEYLEDTDSVHIIDFKTGKNEEEQDSLQLPIYTLLVSNLQKRPIGRASYWYLDRETNPREIALPDPTEALSKVSEIAKRIKLGRQIEHFKCPKGGCFACRPLEEVINGKGELVGVSEYKQDIYVI